MTTSENDNLPSGGTDTAQPSISLDDAANLDFYDPHADTVEDEQEPQSNDEPVEADGDDAGQETEEPAPDADADDEAIDGEDQPEPVDIKDDVTVALQSGEKVALSELKSGYMRQADYSRKTMALGDQRRDLEALATSVTNSVNAIADYLTKMLPPAPDPNLAVTDASAYVRQKALHEQAMANISEVLKAAQAPKAATSQLTQQQHKDLLQAETAKLAEAFPQVATAEGHKKFFEAAASTARELGYTDAEIGSATDHRLFKLAHYARLGLQAEAARAKAKQKVVNVPPVAPNKRPAAQDATKRQANRKAVDRLKRSGSLDDAINIDWE